MISKFKATLQEFSDTCRRLDEVLREEKTEFIRDSAIKRFELTFDASWKAIKAFLEERGATCTSPLGCFREAYRQGLIEYEVVWADLVETRNKSAHTYSQALAEEIYVKLPEALAAFQKLADVLKEQEETDEVP